MAFNETVNRLDHLLGSIIKDLTKVGRGNKSAAQRVRVGTIRLERVARLFRKESVAQEKGIHKKNSLKTTRRKQIKK